jgi:hypothetical protein
MKLKSFSFTLLEPLKTSKKIASIIEEIRNLYP